MIKDILSTLTIILASVVIIYFFGRIVMRAWIQEIEYYILNQIKNKKNEKEEKK